MSEETPNPNAMPSAEELQRRSEALDAGQPIAETNPDGYFSQEAADRAKRLIDLTKEAAVIGTYQESVSRDKGDKYRRAMASRFPTVHDPELGQEVLNTAHTPSRARKADKANLKSWDGRDSKNAAEINAWKKDVQKEHHRLATDEASRIHPDAFKEPAEDQAA